MADASVHDGAKLHIEDWPWQIRTGRREDNEIWQHFIRKKYIFSYYYANSKIILLCKFRIITTTTSVNITFNFI